MAEFPVRDEAEVLKAVSYLNEKAAQKDADTERRLAERENAEKLAKRQRLPKKKLCTGPCQSSKPRSAFDCDASKPDGLKSWCKECRAAKRDADEMDHVTKTLMDMDAKVLARISEHGTFGGTNLPHQVQALEAILTRLGGVEGLATLFVANAIAAPPGSMARDRALGKVLHLIELCSDDGKISKPRELMDDDELKQTAAKRMAKLGIVVDAEDVRQSA